MPQHNKPNPEYKPSRNAGVIVDFIAGTVKPLIAPGMSDGPVFNHLSEPIGHIKRGKFIPNKERE